VKPVEIDYERIDPGTLRSRPRLPSPAWSLLFLGLAGFDLWQALTWMMVQGPRQRTPEVALHIEADVAWGIVLGAALVAGYLHAAPRNFERSVVASVQQKRPRIGLGLRLLGMLVFVVLYGLTFLPVLFAGPEGLAGRSLAAAPVDIAMAACLWDLRRYRRAAWKILRHFQGEAALPRDPALESPEVRGLSAEQVRDYPRWRYNLPVVLAVVQAALLFVGLTSLAAGWSPRGRFLPGAPALAGIFAAWGLAIGLWGAWHEARKLRGRELEMALCAVLREPRPFPLVWWDWWGYTVILVLFGGALVVLSRLPEAGMRVAGGALAGGYGLGVAPLYRHYARPWALALKIIREIKSRGGGANEAAGTGRVRPE
jgi:hypothetical protein